MGSEMCIRDSFMGFAALPVMLLTTYYSPLALFLPRLLGFME